ncbi:MAG: hypothetical protein U0002_02975 [Thermoanaerobaculia bacterium]
MASEYDSLFGRRSPSPEAQEEFAEVQAKFRSAAAPYLASPWPWLGWGLVLPTLALLTPSLLRAGGYGAVLLGWSLGILVAGAVEALSMWRRGAGASLLAAWALRAQGNLSLVGLLLSGYLVWRDVLSALPALWLLLLGHSFYILGGLSFPALRRYGLGYQLGGALALVAGSRTLMVFAATTFVANLGLALGLAFERRRRSD